jgi:hypothetical protein
MALATLTLADVPALALTGATKLGNRHRLVELADGAEHLAHQLGGRRVVRNEPGLSAATRSIPRSRKLGMADFLNHQVAANRLAVSTMIVRTPLPSIRLSMAGHAAAGSRNSA